MAATEKIVRCPGCGGDSVFAPSNLYRPFCSDRCKNLDLGAWASEAFRVPTEAPRKTYSSAIRNAMNQAVAPDETAPAATKIVAPT